MHENHFPINVSHTIYLSVHIYLSCSIIIYCLTEAIQNFVILTISYLDF